MANCWVSENGVPNAEAGGAIFINYGSAILQNCIVSTNARAGICGNGLPWTVVNCSVIGNFALGINFGYGSLGITNSIIYFNNSNGEQTHSDVTNAVTFAYSDVQGGVMPGLGNLSLNPSLCPTNQSLLADSPCIDAGNPDPAFNDLCMDSTACSPLARGGVRNDMGAYGGPRACAWGAGNMPAIITQPQSQASCPGGTLSFTVGVTGWQPLAYQWFFQNAPIPGQTDPQLTLSNVHSGNAGTYLVTVSNAFGSVTSAPVQLLVYDTCFDLRMYAGLTVGGPPGSDT